MNKVSVLLTVFLIFVACLTNSPTDDSYDSFNLQYEKTLTGEIDRLFYNGFRSSNNRILDPYERSEDGFYIIESSEMLDSVFKEVSYPGIDTLFPENGILVIFDNSFPYKYELTGNVAFFTDDTLKVDLTIRDWNMLTDPGVWELVLPIGVTFK